MGLYKTIVKTMAKRYEAEIAEEYNKRKAFGAFAKTMLMMLTNDLATDRKEELTSFSSEQEMNDFLDEQIRLKKKDDKGTR